MCDVNVLPEFVGFPPKRADSSDSPTSVMDPVLQNFVDDNTATIEWVKFPFEQVNKVYSCQGFGKVTSTLNALQGTPHISSCFLLPVRCQRLSTSQVSCEMAAGLPLMPLLGVSESFQKHIFLGCAQALKKLHSMKFVHRDIKLDNFILLKKGKGVRLIDFDTVTNKSEQRLVGTPSYFSKEYVMSEIANQKSDIWALGVTMLNSILKLTLLPDCEGHSGMRFIINFFVRDSAPKLSDWSYLYKLQNVNYENYNKSNLMTFIKQLESNKSHSFTQFQKEQLNIIFKCLLCEPENRSLNSFMVAYEAIELNDQ